MGNLISIIIPTFNEEKNIHRLLHVLKCMEHVEIIIVDGGSRDHTAAIVESYEVRLIRTDPGRAKQMNAGAQIARGNVLWFIHADSHITSKMADELREVLQDEKIVGGGFSLRFDNPSYLLKWIARGSNWRARRLHLFFGDQGFFVRRSIFEHIGGFPPVALMEDWMMCQRVKQVGRLILLPMPIITSARRFQKHGIVRTFLLMQWIKLLFLCGVPTSTLERMYRRG